MGEAANQMNHNNGSHHNGTHKRVDQLRDEISRKRDLLSLELDELRRRREVAIRRSKETAKMAAGGMVGLFVISSLVNAVFDLFRKDKPEAEVDEHLLLTSEEAKTVAKKQATSSALLSALTTIVINEVRKAAIDYARKELRARLIDSRMQARLADNDGKQRDVA